jgi:hypothetical protein
VCVRVILFIRKKNKRGREMTLIKIFFLIEPIGVLTKIIDVTFRTNETCFFFLLKSKIEKENEEEIIIK